MLGTFADGCERDSEGALAGHVDHADNLACMRQLEDGCCDLIYSDPPFERSGVVTHDSSSKQPIAAQDRKGLLDDYLGFLRPRLAEMFRVLADHGSLYIHLDWRAVHYVKVMLDDIFGSRCFLNEVIWSYRTGGRPGAWFSRQHDTVLLYAKNPPKHTFHRLRDGTYRTRDLRMDASGRPYKTTRNGRVYFHPDGPALSDVWDIPFLSTVSRERTGYPSQKPEALLQRAIRASSNEGDLVADFFCGSGTTLVAAKRLNRRWLGCDISPEAVAIARRRLDQACTGDLSLCQMNRA